MIKINFSIQGHVSAGLILGGVDPAGSHVIQIHPYGSTAKLPYTTMGSGSLAAMSVLEDGWKHDMNEEQVIFRIKAYFIFLFRPKNWCETRSLLVFCRMVILDHRLIWSLLPRIKLTTSENMTLFAIRANALGPTISNRVLRLFYLKM